MYSSLIGSEREFCTFEADSLYIWGRFSIHLRQILYTFEANLYIWGKDHLFFSRDASEPIREQDLYV